MKENESGAVGVATFKRTTGGRSRRLNQMDSWARQRAAIRRVVEYGEIEDDDRDLVIELDTGPKPFAACSEEELVGAFGRFGEMMSKQLRLAA